MPTRHAICLVVDGLRASALGAYGNTSYPTPQFDALASRSLVADWLWADSPQLAEFYRSVWQGEHALRRAGRSPGDLPAIFEALHNDDMQQWLVTDEPWLIDQSQHLPLDKTLLFDNGAEHAAKQIEDTAIARFFAETIENLQQWRDDTAEVSSVAWLHSQGMFGPWDAPIAMREALLDEEDPLATEFVQPPTELRNVEDPDITLSHRVAYAAQIAVLDACVGAFVQAVEEAFDGEKLLLMLASSRGFALGEHTAIGTGCTELYEERLHLPWLLYPLGNSIPLPRQTSLSQPADIGATLLDWFGLEEAGTASDGLSHLPLLTQEPCEARELAFATGTSGERALRTPSWMLQLARDERVRLYSKPDDRWEHNDVAELCPDVVEQLQSELARAEQSCREGQPLPLSPHDDASLSPQQ